MEMMSKKHVVQCCLAAWLRLLADGTMKSAIKATRRTKSAATFSSSNLTFSTAPMAVSVENPSGGSSDFDMDSELRLPPATQAHLNHYQPNGMLHGGGVTGAQNLDVTTTQWGQNLDHATIDNDANVINAVRDHVLQVQP